MKFAQVTTPSLSQYSYVIAEDDQMIVIDPGTDVKAYLELSTRFNAPIRAIFETHRHEDFLSGAPSLAELTGAKVYRSAYEDPGYTYGTAIDEHFELILGPWQFRPIHTPGHTKGHLCYLLCKEDKPYMLFSGDTLFYGDLGRSDFYGEPELASMTHALYQSIFTKLLPLGDEVILLPAHGAGSACGSSIEERPCSTLGYERLYSPALQVQSAQEFVQTHARLHPKPPYMEYMEVMNLTTIRPVWKEYFPPAEGEADWLIDVRSREAFLQAHFKGSIWMRPGIISAHLGWFARHDHHIRFCADSVSREELSEILRTIQSMGYEKFSLMPQDSIREAKMRALEWMSLSEISAREFLKIRPHQFVLDVRKPEQVQKEDKIIGDLHVPVEHLAEVLSKLDRSRTIYVLCNSGERATVAASRLEREGFRAVVVAGGIQALHTCIIQDKGKQ